MALALSNGGAAVGPRERLITLAYMDRKRDREVNAERHAQARANRGCCSFSGWRERVIDMYSSRQEFTHTEIVFRIDTLPEAIRRKYCRRARETDVLAIAAQGDRGAVAVARPFSNQGYAYFTISCTLAQYNRALHFALKQVGKPYDTAGASYRLLIFPAAPTTERWWCASLCHAILRKVGLLTYYPLNTLDVDNIVKLVIKGARERRRHAMAAPHHFRYAEREVTNALFSASPGTRKVSAAYIAGEVGELIDGSCRQMVEGEGETDG